jgi:D-amino-acid dehydrogenase
LRVAVIGAGIIGVTTAYECAAQGHEVTVFERRTAVASETSFANAGVLAPGYVTPWAAPGMPWKVLRHLLSRHAPVRLGAGALAELPWIWRWWRACRPSVHAGNRAAMQRLAHFSRERLRELTDTLALEYQQAQGYMVLLRGPRELAMARPGLKLLGDLGVAFELLDARRCREIEPGLNPETSLEAAIHLPADGVGNCRHFAHLLMQEARRLGAEFRFDCDAKSIAPAAQPTLRFQRVATGAQTQASSEESEQFDAVIVCAGVHANRLLTPIGLALPLAPVYGYSITAPLRHVEGHPHLGPRSALMDEKFKVAISRLGDRVRVAGSAELGSAAGQLDQAALRTLYKVLDDWFPGAALTSKAQPWKGARPMLPDGPPVLGASGAPGVWLNLGHGSSGWALSCGSARVLAEAINGGTAPIDVAGLGLERLRR